ncbi:NAD(P)/FAD-dependent oxidoreductase [Maribacter sp. CXY002]|uniref:NAD(P)/FAD-dependent oxidoreductase n=1 Tax=Maribacter luteocoastalis TaxID=3407671 RepID=UPI003B677047
MKKYDVLIVGGGLAGLTAANALARLGYGVLVYEAKPYPHHKVCGEYVSNEVLPYLKTLGIDLLKLGGVPITTFEISTLNGHKTSVPLDLGGTGISRYALDNILYKEALSQGVNFLFEKVSDIQCKTDEFLVTSDNHTLKANMVIGAYGKRSSLDKALKRDFIGVKNSWLAVKSHYRNDDFPNDVVALHNFKGGYGGLSKTETGAVNFCYLAHYESFKKCNTIEEFNTKEVSKNKHLQQFLDSSEPIFEKPLSIAQISFHKKEPVVNHVLMCGDTAGLIHPLCGNGMAMAIHSAKLAAECIHAYFQHKGVGRKHMEQEYCRIWNSNFKNRLWYGRNLQYILLHKNIMNLGLKTIGKSDYLLKSIIKKTHGNGII